jgi:uncharacterized BrkB/YihY/UPF0761 family membrane protein
VVKLRVLKMRVRLSERGQALDVRTILGVIAVLVAIVVGALVYTKVSDALGDIADENSLAENIKTDVDDVADTIFTLMPILVLVSIVLGLFLIFGGQAPAR